MAYELALISFGVAGISVMLMVAIKAWDHWHHERHIREGRKAFQLEVAARTPIDPRRI